MFELYSESAKRSIFAAKHEANKLGSPEVEPEHVLLGLLQLPDIAGSILRGLAAWDVRSRLTVISQAPNAEQDRSVPSDLPLSKTSRQALVFAEQEAQKSGFSYVGAEHVLLGLLLVEECFAARLLREKGISVESVRSTVEALPTLREATQHIEQRPNSSDSGDSTIVSQIQDLLKKGEPRNALKLIDEVLSSDHRDHKFLVRLLCPVGMAISRSVGDLPLTTNYGEQLLAVMPDDIRTLYWLADCLDLQGQRERAKRYATKCYQLSLEAHSQQAVKLVGLLKKRFPELGPQS